MTGRFRATDVAPTAFAMTLSAVVLAACSSTSSGKATFSTANGTPGANTSSTTPSTSTSQAASGACGGGAVAGQGGILQVFCGGPGDAKITMGSASKELTGGTCVEQAGQYAINFGAVAGPDFPSGQSKPDYLGALIDDSNGALGAFTVIIDGTSSGTIVNRVATLSAAKKSVMLKGKRLDDGATVSVNLTC